MPLPLTTHKGFVFKLLLDNIDTDQIIPSREIKTVSKTGLKNGLFANWRYLDASGYAPDPAFALNTAPGDRATILIAGENFGCGSSREHAVWALADYGFRCIIARSFGDIFYNNSIRNCLLPIALDTAHMQALLAALDNGATAAQLEIDLERQTVTPPENSGQTIAFDIDATRKHMLTNGLDAISLTEKYAEDINTFLHADQRRRAWAYPAPPAP